MILIITYTINLNEIFFFCFIFLFVLFFSFLINKLYLWSSFWLTVKLRGRYKEFPCTPCGYMYTMSPTINILHYSAAFVTSDKLTIDTSSKALVYIQVHSWFCTFCAFWQMFNNMSHHCSSIHNNFTALKILCVPPIHSILLPNPATTNLFTVFTVLSF